MFGMASFLFTALTSWAVAGDVPARTGPLATALDKCVSCHAKVSAMSPDLQKADGLASHLPWVNDGLLAAMMAKLGNALTADEAAALKNVVEGARHGALDGDTQGFKTPGRVAPCYTTDDERRRKLELLPKDIAPTSLQAIRLAGALRTGSLIAYDRTTVPHAWQSESLGGNMTPAMLVNDQAIVRGREGRRYDYPQKGSDEFPWKRAAGTDLAPGVTALHFIIPPDGRSIAETLERSKSAHPDYYGGVTGVKGPNLGWTYRDGVQFVEALSVADPVTGKPRVLEYRLRMKDRQGVWRSDVLRPFASPQELRNAVQALCGAGQAPAECRDPSVDAFVAEVVPPRTQTVTSAERLTRESLRTGMFGPLQLNSLAPGALLETADVQKLPPLPPKVISALLDRAPFQSVMGRPWISAPGGKGTSYGPMTDSDFHVVPKGAMLGHLKLSQGQCRHCHSSAGKHVKRYDPSPKQMNAVEPDQSDGGTRSWYDFVVGDDDTFSWNPFSTRAAATMGKVLDPSSLAKCLGDDRGLAVPKAEAEKPTADGPHALPHARGRQPKPAH